MTNEIAEMWCLAIVVMDHAVLQALPQADLMSAEQGTTGPRPACPDERTRRGCRIHVAGAARRSVAGELRAVLTSIQNSADVDRMGALGSARRQDHASSPPDHVQPEEVDRYIAEMGEVAVVLGLPPKSADVSRSREGGEPQRIQDHARMVYTVNSSPC